MEKRKWETPKLICLYRGRPEEGVLQACKIGATSGPGVAGCAPDHTPCSTIGS